MPRKKATARWDVDPVQPLTISVPVGRNRNRRKSGILRFSPQQFKKVRTHLDVNAGETANRLKQQLQYLCASAARTKFQDEDGPTRSERMVAMQQFSATIDNFTELLSALKQSGSNQLAADLDKFINAKLTKPDGAFQLGANLTATLAHLSRSVSRLTKDELLDRHHQQLENVAADCLALAVMIQAGGDAMHPEFMYRCWQLCVKNEVLIDEEYCGALQQLTGRLAIMKAAVAELYLEYKAAGGARKATTIPELELRLAYIYQLYSGKKFTHSPYKGYGNYCGEPTSHGGAFIQMVLEALLPTRVEPVTSGLREVVKRLKDPDVRRSLEEQFSEGTDFVKPEE